MEFIIVVCSLWACANTPWMEFPDAKTCIAVAAIENKRLPLDSGMTVNCMTRERYDAVTKIQ